MDDSVYFKVCAGKTEYDRLLLTKEKVSVLQKRTEKPSKKQIKIISDGVLLHFLLRELKNCDNCRCYFVTNVRALPDVNTVKCLLVPTQIDTIDYKWNQRVSRLVHERCELDSALSWLSTLGGAFSALGDYYVAMAETAGKISLRQLQLALRLGDESVVARCHLYFGLSLIQQGHFTAARNIIRRVYDRTVAATTRDDRLIRMCKGIWAKLQYEKQVCTVKMVN